MVHDVFSGQSYTERGVRSVYHAQRSTALAPDYDRGFMLIADPKLFSLVVPTWQGGRFVPRLLDYLDERQFPCSIVIADDSTNEDRAFVERCAAQYPRLKITVDLYPHGTSFIDKLVRALQRVPSQFVMLQAQDDFPVPGGVESCVRELQSHPQYAAARGRIGRFFLGHDGSPAASVNLTLIPHAMRAYLADDPVERVVDHLKNYASTLYSVHRRESLLKAFERTAAATQHVIFFQYLSSALTVLAGKVWCGEELYYVRQNHRESWGAKAKRDDRDHWPQLLVASDYSERYAQFRNALARALAEAKGTAPESVYDLLDEAAVEMLVGSICARRFEDPHEESFMRRLKTAGTVERMELENIVQFVMRYPETY